MLMASSTPQNEAEGEIQTGPNWLELPRDITANILQKVGVVEIVTSACLVCPLWWKICRYAVERSLGHLEDIDIQYFGTDDLLKFIAHRDR